MIEMPCPNCRRDLTIPDEYAGQTGTCQYCQAPVTVPGIAVPPPVQGPGGFVPGYLPAGPYPQPPSNPMDSIIPTKNPAALTGYYCGVFALIPCLGLILGPIALILGIKGLKYVNQYPGVKGRTHAWVGIIMGGICGLGNWVVLAVAMMGGFR